MSKRKEYDKFIKKNMMYDEKTDTVVAKVEKPEDYLEFFTALNSVLDELKAEGEIDANTSLHEIFNISHEGK